jgi:Domain of Unknown Function (DUF928)
MTSLQSIGLLISASLMAGVAWIGSIPLPTELARAQSTLHYSPPPPPQDQGAPTGRSRGGASRDPLCGTGNQLLTALVPSLPGEEMLEIVWARTVSDRPAFWFYVPYTLNPNIPLEFILKDAQNQVLYQTTFEVAESSPGIVKFTLPDTVAPLEIDKMYHWDFRVYCHPTTPVFVGGWIQRIALDRALESQIEAATPREQIALYAENGIWYEALSNLAEQRQLEPEDPQLIEDWNSLLESVGLQDIATESIVECCSTPDSSP